MIRCYGASFLRRYGPHVTPVQRKVLAAVAATPKHLGARIAGLMVLHTWGQTLQLHPHVHAIVPGGGLSPDGQQWVPCPAGFFLAVKVLGRVFRGKMLDYLKQESETGRLPWTSGLSHLADRRRFKRFLSQLYRAEWNVYVRVAGDDTKAAPEAALKYLSAPGGQAGLARYTYCVAISNDRIESVRDGRVTFWYKDYAHDARWRRMTLWADEFLRRFLVHVLPRGLVRIRTFGFLASPHRPANGGR